MYGRDDTGCGMLLLNTVTVNWSLGEGGVSKTLVKRYVHRINDLGNCKKARHGRNRCRCESNIKVNLE